jgi:hypothetical protein
MRRWTKTLDGTQLEKPLLLWREIDGRRRGLACLPTFCDNPACTCQEAHLAVFEVDGGFREIRSRDERVMVICDAASEQPPDGHLVAVVDLEAGRLVRFEKVKPRRRRAELIRWLEEAIDAGALAELRERWRSFKEACRFEAERGAATTWREMDWTEWDAEEPVAWNEVHPETATDPFEQAGATYEAVDHYCILPECGCEEVAVRFFKVVDDQIVEMIGEVLVEAGSAEVVGTNNAPGQWRVLERLWAAYEARHDLSELSRRQREMQRLGPQIHALRASQLGAERRSLPGGDSAAAQLETGTGHRGGEPMAMGAKVGRNDPCPCGSGRKYKRCCGANR